MTRRDDEIENLKRQITGLKRSLEWSNGYLIDVKNHIYELARDLSILRLDSKYEITFREKHESERTQFGYWEKRDKQQEDEMNPGEMPEYSKQVPIPIQEEQNE